MGCSSCSTGSDGLPKGCKNNGACGTYGCNKLEVFDWLAGMELPDGQKPFDIVEVRFKNSRKGFYRNATNLELYPGDVVAVEVSPGHDIGVVSLTGELVRVQMKRKEVKDNYEIKKIYRKAKEDDIAKWQEGRKIEQQTMMRAREIARSLNLDMKLSDVEYQGDKSKATFFYTADDRVDFRELIKRYAEEFRVRIDMRQIGYRFEAGRLGGIGSCGRELCCSSWLTDFRAVSTSAARYQQLSLNPAKLAGQCGKLKCCLNYELDQYVEAMKDFPSVNTKLHLPKGLAVHFKTDIFQRTMYFIYDGQPGEAPFPLSIEAIHEIIDRNKKGIAVETLEDFLEEVVAEKETDFAEVVGQDSLTRFDRKKGKPKGNPNRRDRRPDGQRSGEPRDNQRQGPPKPSQGKDLRPPGQGQQKQQGPPPQKAGQQENRNRPNRPPGNKRPERNEPRTNDGKPPVNRPPQNRPPQERPPRKDNPENPKPNTPPQP
ncbi:MAG: hypothetical protein IPP69_05835 [Flavobacteriales bacterium]|nr:hypothetical protein [Flavobacteriales bacterium]